MARASRVKKVGRAVFWLGLLGAAGVAATSLHVQRKWQARILPPEKVPTLPVALVFGAGLAANQVPSPVLAERIDAGIALYRAGKVKKLLLSGDNSDKSHDETRAMRRYAIDRGVPASDAVGDYAGLSTYDTCYRAHAIFGVERALLVTQRFHLPRALYLANALGIDAYGVAADGAGPKRSPYRMRELLSRSLAWGMSLLQPPPKFLGEKEPLGG